jgi:hypothetical protein
VVQIIENEQDAGGAELVGFRPYRSANDSDRILADWQHVIDPVDHKGPASTLGAQLGTAVEIEFQPAVAAAHMHGTAFVWVDDPDGLFSSFGTPLIQLGVFAT